MFDFDADDRGIFDSDSKKRQFITPWTVNYIKHFVSKTIKFMCILHIILKQIQMKINRHSLVLAQI